MFGEEDAGGEPVCFREVGEFDAGFVGGGGGGEGLGGETGETAGEVENSFFETERCDALDTACLVVPCPDSQRVFATSCQCSPSVVIGVVVSGVGILRLVVPMRDRDSNPMSCE